MVNWIQLFQANGKPALSGLRHFDPTGNCTRLLLKGTGCKTKGTGCMKMRPGRCALGKGSRMFRPKTVSAHGCFGTGCFDTLRPTQTDDSAHLVKTLHTAHEQRRSKDGRFGTHLVVRETASYTRSRAERSKSKRGCLYNVVTT